MGFIARTIEWAGFPEEIRSQVICGGETGSRVTCGKGGGRRKWCKKVSSHLWGSSVSGWGDSLPQTLITGEEAQVLFWYIYISPVPRIYSNCQICGQEGVLSASNRHHWLGLTTFLFGSNCGDSCVGHWCKPQPATARTLERALPPSLLVVSCVCGIWPLLQL